MVLVAVALGLVVTAEGCREAGASEVVDAGRPAVDGGQPPDAGASGLELVQGELFEGARPSERLVRAHVRLTNATKYPLSLLPTLFKLRLSTGVEVFGSPVATALFAEACPQGDISVGASASCDIGFTVDFSNQTTTVTGLAYTLPDASQWVVERAIPTCEQCGALLGCVDFQRSDFACGRCGNPCGAFEGCSAGTCVPVTTKTLAVGSDSCQATCAPKRCVRFGSSGNGACHPTSHWLCDASVSELQKNGELSGCTQQDLICVCEG